MPYAMVNDNYIWRFVANILYIRTQENKSKSSNTGLIFFHKLFGSKNIRQRNS